ncbi:MAG: (E)-4-hydroxy-3-methylbut-2-enyl-diphosphate synthase [bacterium]
MSKYCEDLFNYQRRKTRVVYVGDVRIGGDNPIRIQSMTIADTMNTQATVNEIVQLADAGCEIVRVTAPSIKEAENLKHIRAALRRRGVQVPLVADIHYTPNAALIAADYVEKVRINPGNYADKKKFEQREYTDAQYERELLRIEQRFKPLVLKCKSLGRAMRIGTNHGSLSDRIMNRYGDSPQGMVESALEFVRICEKYDYCDVILSMKASNPQVAIQAYRLLAARMDELGMDYPFHLGVTEAGDGEEARVKSAVGIGALLEDGIGDTIRVSLTENSVAEIPVAFRIAKKFNRIEGSKNGHNPFGVYIEKNGWAVKLPNPFVYRRRETGDADLVSHQLGSRHVPRVELSFPKKLSELQAGEPFLESVSSMNGNGQLNLLGNGSKEQKYRCETLTISLNDTDEIARLRELKERLHRSGVTLPLAVDVTTVADSVSEISKYADRIVYTVSLDGEFSCLEGLVRSVQSLGKPLEWKIDIRDLGETVGLCQFVEDSLTHILDACRAADYWNLLFSLDISEEQSVVFPYRYLAGRLDALDAHHPVLLRYRSASDFDSLLLDASAQLGSLLCDGIGDAIHLDADIPATDLLRLSYNVLQATRLRISKTEFISCPSCGRTLFNLQTTTERIKSKTGHLKGVKIAIMGCIVNGPGEMADADFGYVGAGPGKVDLFVGKQCVKRNIPEKIADSELVALIKSYGKWVEP